MGQNSHISWTNNTFNYWIGCTKVSAGCDNCYAEREQDLRYGRAKWGKGNARYLTSESNRKTPFKWEREAARSPWTCPDCTMPRVGHAESGPCHVCGVECVPNRPRVFTASLSDVFDEEVSDEWRDGLFEIIRQTPHLDWLVLTKRLAKMLRYVGAMKDVPVNVWWGCSVEDQATADQRIPELLKMRKLVGNDAVLWLSIEPLIGSVDISPWLAHNPVYDAVQTERGVRLPIGAERRLGDSAGWDDLENSQTRVGSVEEAGGQSSVQEGASGARPRVVPSGADHDERREGLRAGPSLGLPSPSRTDTNRTDGQPQGRDEEAERPGQPRVGNSLGATNSRHASAEGGTRLQPARATEQHDEADDKTGRGDTTAQSQRREVDPDREGLRSGVSDGVEDCTRRSLVAGISWAVVGGESGPAARPMHPRWPMELRDQCVEAGVAFHFKQWGEYVGGIGDPQMFISLQNGTEQAGGKDTHDWGEGYVSQRVGKKAGRLLDGVTWNQFPEVA